MREQFLKAPYNYLIKKTKYMHYAAFHYLDLENDISKNLSLSSKFWVKL